ncbi:MAG: hydantoinase B/oxoprolinase family protein [Gammaproteobacteria bacterium]|nr:hydantoinase B/oxoprolinase family protein [Gammaproteobacteria bacterium]
MVDKITAEVLRSKFDAVVAEMRATVINTACSTTVSEANQCCNGLFTEAGSLVTIDNPLYLSSMADTAAAVLDYFQYDLGSEDILLTNDPYGGGSRLQEFTAFAPVSFEEEIVLYVGVRAHTEDIGGDLRGNYNPRATDIWAEGVRCPPVKIYRDGKLLKDTLNTIALNSRNPKAFRLDLEAMFSAIRIGQTRMEELLHDYGAEVVLDALDWSVDYAEARFSSMLKDWGDISAEGSCRLMHDCQGRNNLDIRVRLETTNGRLLLDFSETDAQSTGFINTTPAQALSYALLPVFAALGTDVPKNAGSLRCVDLVAPEGSLVNARMPAPTGWSASHVGTDLALAVTDALSGLAPEKVANVAGNSMLIYMIRRGIRNGFTVEQLAFTDYARFTQGGCSGAAGRDGWGMPGISSTTPLPSIEMFEAEVDGEIRKLEYVTDSAGAGQWRGGPGTEACIELPAPDPDEFYLTACVFPRQQAAGFAGGTAGTDNSVLVHSGEAKINVENAYVDQLLGQRSDLSIRMGGGAGWGNPMARNPEQVLADVLDGYVSLEAAEEQYGVIVDPEKLQIDTARTAELRKELDMNDYRPEKYDDD